MISRSNSTAGQHLRRAKSTTSTHTPSSTAHHPVPITTTLTDPAVAFQYAETAAVEAFNRARQNQMTNPSYNLAVPTKLQRRKSLAHGGSSSAEGSHFENARLERRHSASKKRNNRDDVRTKVARADRSDKSENGILDRAVVITLEKSGSQFSNGKPGVSTSCDAESGQHETPTPCRRPSQRNKGSGSQLQVSSANEYGSHTSYKLQIPTDYHAPSAAIPQMLSNTAHGLPMQRPHTDDEARALARDKCLRDFQQRKVRERKSFIIETIQKFRPPTSQKSYRSGYDTSLPPFNYADSCLTPPTLAPMELQLPDSTIYVESNVRKTRSFSETVKNGLKKLIRRSSIIPRQLPAQHIQATQLHQPVFSPPSTPGVKVTADEDPFTFPVECELLTASGTEAQSANSRQSVDAFSTSKSRVTSWTASSVARTCSTAHDSKQDDTADIGGTALLRSSSISTLRGAGSSLSGSIKRRLRRKSKSFLNSSEESSALYAALQERLYPEANYQQEPLEENNENEETEIQSARDTLPSQRRSAKPFHLPRNLWADSTIRSVTPDGRLYKSDILSPVAEIQSPQNFEQNTTAVGSDNGHSSTKGTPKTQLHRRHAVKASVPSKAQIAKRVQRNESRWQGPLEELSPQTEVGSRHLIFKGDNPYRLNSLNRTSPSPNAFAHHGSQHINTEAHTPHNRETLLSPSVYSRATDEGSPRARSSTPLEQGGTMITITGHEVRSYPISPTKNRRPFERSASQNSRDWRRWLSNELKDWKHSASPDLLALPDNTLKDMNAPNAKDPVLSGSKTEKDGKDASDSSTPLRGSTPIEPKRERPLAARRQSGFMNERYPMLASGAESSDGSTRTKTGAQGNRNTADGSVTVPKEKQLTHENTSQNQCLVSQDFAGDKDSTALKGSSSSNTRPQVQSKHGMLQKNSVITCSTLDTTSQQSKFQVSRTSQQQRPSLQARSASDLRVNYKNDRSAQFKTLEVRRRPYYDYNAVVLEDNTIQNISAGPYASLGVDDHKQFGDTTYGYSSDTDKENTPNPHSDHLLTVPSSEYPSLGSNKANCTVTKSRVLSESTVHQVTKGSTTVQPKPALRVGRGSPGQRLVTGWLDAKKSKENSPIAFL